LDIEKLLAQSRNSAATQKFKNGNVITIRIKEFQDIDIIRQKMREICDTYNEYDETLVTLYPPKNVIKFEHQVQQSFMNKK